jgi:hypothetical protein
MKENAQRPTPNVQRPTSGKNGEADRFVISSIIVLAVCSDGKARLVRLNDNQPRRLFRYLDGMCDHRVNLIMAPVKVVLEQMPKKKNVFARFWKRFTIHDSR